MTQPIAPSTDHEDHGVSMPDPTTPTSDSPNPGALMTDPTTPSTDPNTNGAPMTDPTTKSEPAIPGAPMTDPTTTKPSDPTPGAPMTDPTNSPTRSTNPGDPMPTTHDEHESAADTQRGPDLAARAALHSHATDLGPDEVRVLARIAERLRGGRETYGPLALATDARDFRGKEAREEVEDALVYLACAWLKAETAQSHKEVN